MKITLIMSETENKKNFLCENCCLRGFLLLFSAVVVLILSIGLIYIMGSLKTFSHISCSEAWLYGIYVGGSLLSISVIILGLLRYFLSKRHQVLDKIN